MKAIKYELTLPPQMTARLERELTRRPGLPTVYGKDTAEKWMVGRLVDSSTVLTFLLDSKEQGVALTEAVQSVVGNHKGVVVQTSSVDINVIA